MNIDDMISQLVKDNNADIENLDNTLKRVLHKKSIEKYNINLCDKDGKTILFYSANEEIATKLLEYGANWRIKDLSGKNALEQNEYVKFAVRNNCFSKQRLMGII